MDERTIRVCKAMTWTLYELIETAGLKNTSITICASNTLGIESEDITIHTADEPENIHVIYHASAMPGLYDGWREETDETPVE